MVPFTPRLISAVLPNLAHHVPMIQSAAIRTNKLLLNVVQALPSPSQVPPRAVEKASSVRTVPLSPVPTGSVGPSRSSTSGKDSSLKDEASDILSDSQASVQSSLPKSRGSVEAPPRFVQVPDIFPSELSRPQSPEPTVVTQPALAPPDDSDLLDYQATVNQLTIQFLSEYEETRVATLKWLIMLHQKAPKKA
jgi:vacuole morphology and inheritance protein 14